MNVLYVYYVYKGA